VANAVSQLHEDKTVQIEAHCIPSPPTTPTTTTTCASVTTDVADTPAVVGVETDLTLTGGQQTSSEFRVLVELGHGGTVHHRVANCVPVRTDAQLTRHAEACGHHWTGSGAYLFACFRV
jgi:hypothetical protein